MRRILGICSIVLISTISLAAQDQYVVKINGDTIYGKVMINPVRDNSRSMFFKAVDGTKGNIKPLRNSFVYYNEKYQFRSVPFQNQKLFMQIVKEQERISLYNYVHKRDNSIVTSRIVIKANQEYLELSVLNFKNQMKEFLSDCPSLLARLETKEFKYKNHQQLFAEYNLCDPGSPVATVNTPAQHRQEVTIPVPPTPQASDKSEIQLLRLKKIGTFRDYLQGLSDFNSKNDVVQLLVDLENRVNQNSDIPNYLWSSLEHMVEGHEEVKQRAQQLRLDIK